MNEFSFPHDEEAKEYFQRVAEWMVKLFNISTEEAIGRINKVCEGQEYIGYDYIYRDNAKQTAQNFYYEEGTYWWVDEWLAENTPKPRPYP